MLDETLEHGDADRAMPPERLAPGTTIGHFRIVRELGAGGMGIVFEAYDPDLDRSVAIKIVRDREAGSSAGQRLVREAQAMARLGHPNVVPVHEVGTIDGQVYVVMELVRGATLGTWLEARRSWREIVRAFVAAGDGLAAAHAAGLIHRDFKPSNVLVDGSGHVRVSDFGLAKEDSPLADGSGPARPAGTPAYMAPEQKAGDEIDARADQYSFAISLDRALAAETTVGRIPRRVRAAIARALAVDPSARFATLDDLLHELRRALDARRRLVAAITAGLAVAAATTAIAAWVMRPAADDCAAGAKLVDDVWSAPIRDALAARFAAVRPGEAVATHTATRLLDGWADAWQLGRRAACQAEPAPRTARIACLDGALGELRAQLAVWNHADAAVIDRATKAATELPDPSACARRATGGAWSSQVRAIADRSAAIRAEARAGHAPAQKPLIAPLLADARALGDPEASAAALLAAGTIDDATDDAAHARDELAAAAIASGKAGDDASMFEALRDEAIATKRLGRPADSLGILDAAEALVPRAGPDRDWQIEWARGDALIAVGKVLDAERVLEHGIATLESRAARDPASDLALARMLAELASAHKRANEQAAAQPLLERALGIEERELGPSHPDVGATLADLAMCESAIGKLDDATAHATRANDVFVAAYGPENVLVGQNLAVMATIEEARDKPDEALALFERARAALEHKLPPEHEVFASIETQIAELYDDRSNCKAAIPHYERALAIFAHRTPESVVHGIYQIRLAKCLGEAGRQADAYAAATRSLAELEHVNAEPRELAETRTRLADMEADRGHFPRAIELLNQLLASTNDIEHPSIAAMRTHALEQLAKWRKKS